MIPCDSYYGSFRTRTFADIFDNSEELVEAYGEFPPSSMYTGGLGQPEIETIYYLLYARYGNSHIAYTDENQFRYALYSIIWQYGPTWKKRLDIQQSLRELRADFTEDGIFAGGKAIYNHSFNPNTAPSTSTMEELLTINDQNTTNYKKSKMEGYAQLLSLLDTDVTGEFIDKFKKLFIVITAPDYPLYYTTEVE
jgi:hypothetical protein